MFAFIRKNFSLPSIIILSIIFSWVTSGFFISSAMSFLAPSNSGSVFAAAILYIVPLAIVWFIVLPIILIGIYLNVKKAKIGFIILIFFVIIGQLNNLAQEKKFFILPFIGYQNAPLTIFEKNGFEKKAMVKLYVPAYLPFGLVPYFHSFYETRCPGIRMTYHLQGVSNMPLEIIEGPASCIVAASEINSPTEQYEPIPIPGFDNVLYYHAGSNFKRVYPLSRHFIQIGETQVQINIVGEMSKDELIKVVRSLH